VIGKINNILRLARVQQYIKNLFIFVPLFFAGQITDLELLLNVLIAFIAFSISASSIYILNDSLDIEEDRQHPQKKFRPLASGDISKKTALVLMFIFFIIGISMMGALSFQAFVILGAYITLNIVYSYYLKHIAIIDVTIIAIGFVLRLFVGSVVAEIQLSLWIILMTFLLSLFIALSKRRSDFLIYLNTGNKMRNVIDGYNLKFTEGAMVIMASVVIVTYTFYATSIEVVQRVQSEYLYLTTLFVILGIMRYLQVVFVENEGSSPTKIVFKDKFMQITILAWTLSFSWILYL
jgi:4-hydroxybenzoate polyprenyltransferase